ncbi:hypothetical protein [Phyllobacterium sp. SB3]|uniref:hypothetical protein n=1 Tax=Phyllobacterium sp. SB3 TaxID=3156073 RepID=UPI0032AFC073
MAKLSEQLRGMQPGVDAYITPERVARYLTAIADTPAPSTAASAMRAPVLQQLLNGDGALNNGQLVLDSNFRNTASTVMIAGDQSGSMPIWYFAHLDTISYLTRPFDGRRFPLVPFCYHLTVGGRRLAQAYRYDLLNERYSVVDEGWIESESGKAFFRSTDQLTRLRPGDRVVPVTPCRPQADGYWTGHFDNAGGVTALAVAAPLLAEAGVNALFAFPDEEEGPTGSGNQVMGRGGSRIIDQLAPPDLAIIADMQQAGTPLGMDEMMSEPKNSVRMGEGAVLSEFSSLARGAVTPPSLYALAQHLVHLLPGLGTKVQESNNTYTSRSDDISVMLKTPNILLLGFPGINRHFDLASPQAALSDIVDLSKVLVYAAMLQPIIRFLSDRGGRL